MSKGPESGTGAAAPQPAARPAGAVPAQGAAAAAANMAAIGTYVVAMAVLTLMDATIKWLSADYHTLQILAFRSLFGFIPVLAFVMVAQGGLSALGTRRPGAHLLRGLVITATAFLFFFAVGRLPLADAYAIIFAAPLFLTALSGPLLGESVGPRRWAAVLVGFAGVLVVLRPSAAGGGGLIDIGAVAALAGALGYALFGALTRLHSRTETNAALTVWSSLVTLGLAGLSLPFVWITPKPEDLALLVLTGLLGGIGSILIVRAFAMAPLAVIAPFEYTTMAWGVVLGFVLFGDLPGPWVWVGTAIVVAAGLYILYRENRARGTAP